MGASAWSRVTGADVSTQRRRVLMVETGPGVFKAAPLGRPQKLRKVSQLSLSSHCRLSFQRFFTMRNNARHVWT